MTAKKVVKWGLIGFAALLILIQLIPVNHSNPPVTSEIIVPNEVMSIFRESCYDCHSNETNWRWYTYVAPVSWLTAYDVKEGRDHLNFSEWGNLPADKQAKKTEEIWEEVDKGKMPLKIYTLTHPEVVPSQTEKETLKNWSMAAGAEETGHTKGEHEGHEKGKHED